MICSMTAFAAGEVQSGALTVSGEVRSYNSRFLDVTLRLPPACGVLEEKIRSLVSGRLGRGRVEVRVRVDAAAEGAAAFEIDAARAEALNAALERLRERFDWEVRISLDYLAGAGGVIAAVREPLDPEALWPAVEACLQDALTGLVAMRRREGEHLEEDIAGRLAEIEKMLDTVEGDSAGLPAVYRDRLRERIGMLTGEGIDLDPARVVQEAAVLADRSDVSEEITRARSHLRQFRDIMASEEPAGRKLNFLLQEFNREFNTIGSKTNSAGVSHTVVAAKAELEKIREQVQNVE